MQLELRHLRVAWRCSGPLAGQADELAEFAAAAHRDGVAASPAYASWKGPSSPPPASM
ncbi:hypothetical protein [Actinomadura chokoriensis]|uniref:Uncharacterized protein n=1 Tax=Actinomadura chokoriensis TaxID=454156 RepID=A0ABV4QRQ0_9ACTN